MTHHLWHNKWLPWHIAELAVEMATLENSMSPTTIVTIETVAIQGCREQSVIFQ
jgi:hypothetical protein